MVRLVSAVLVRDIASHYARRCSGIVGHFMRELNCKRTGRRIPRQKTRIISGRALRIYPRPRRNEQLLRALPPVSRFLRLAGLTPAPFRIQAPRLTRRCLLSPALDRVIDDPDGPMGTRIAADTEHYERDVWIAAPALLCLCERKCADHASDEIRSEQALGRSVDVELNESKSKSSKQSAAEVSQPRSCVALAR
jgi:hypothetical protein